MTRVQNLRWSLRRRIRRARYAAEDAAYTARRATRRGTWGVSRRWWAMSSEVRTLIIGAGVAVVAVVAVVVLVIPNLPCRAPLGDQCAPPDDAIELVPADAAAYAHLDTDPSSEQYEQAAALAKRLPIVTGRLIRALPQPAGTRLSYAHDVASWLGGQAALALVPAGTGSPRAVALLAVGDEDGAAAFAKQITGEDARTRTRNGAEVELGRGTAVARLQGFLVAGPPAAVAEVIGTAKGGESLLDSDPAREAIDSLPADRFAQLYLSPSGAGDLLAPGEPLGSFEVFVNAGATRGAAAALVAESGALELTVHSVIDPDRAEGSPGFFAALPEFKPSLGGEVSENALAYLALGDPAASLGGLLAQARAGAPGLAAAFDDLGKRLRRSGIDIDGDLLSLLTSEVAIAIEPGRGGPGDLSGVPYLTLIAGEVDADEATAALDRLQGPIARALAGGAGAPVFSETEVKGITVRSLQVSNAVDLSYAIVDDDLVVSTDPRGVAKVAADGSSVTDSARFDVATSGFPDDLTGLLYLNVNDLLGLAEQAGLQADPSYALFRDEFRALEALGLAVERGDDQLDTTIRLAVRG